MSAVPIGADASDAEFRAAAARLVAKTKRQDWIFVVLGIFVLILAMGLLATLIIDLLADGLGRIDKEFLTSFPSRKPAGAGILSAWVGHHPGDVRHRLPGHSAGDRRRASTSRSTPARTG